MSEQAMRRLVVTALSRLDAVAVENPAHPGTPDVNYTRGWIELKQLEEWPAMTTTSIRLPHFTREQRIWLSRRCRKGGLAHLLLLIGHQWMLFDGATAAKVVGRVDAAELRRVALAEWFSNQEMADNLPRLLDEA